jgi:hypothetical protein
MHRLIEKGLMFGNLIHVNSPALVDRYNRALKALTGRETSLTDFHIDISGYSPEIGDELSDTMYLNHAGVNRQFILLTTAQKTAPLLHAKLSSSRMILKQFITQNDAALFALTAKDAVAGELVNSIYQAQSPAALMDIRRIEVTADTTKGTVATAETLGAMIDSFQTEPEAWYDDVLIADMIGLAKETGDITRNPVKLDHMEFQQDSFWTAHFGGFYVFRNCPSPAIIAQHDLTSHGALPINAVYQYSDRSEIAACLAANDLVEPIVAARGPEAAAILHQKMAFILADTALAAGEHLSKATPRHLRQLGRRYAQKLPKAWHGLMALARWAEEEADWPEITSEHPAYFYMLRAKPGPNMDIVNMLLAELTPLDFRQLYICHKDAFYAAYATWSDAKKTYVVDVLEEAYQADKAGVRATLFGTHDTASEPDDVPRAPVSGPWATQERQQISADMIARIGPWRALGER